MYVWARLLRVVATSSRRGPYMVGDESRLSFRCLLTDIDSNVHLNNARYMMLADVGRIDIFYRTGLIEIARKNGWAPMLGGLQAVFAREIRLWKKFDVVSSIETWDGSQVIGRHKFVLEDGRVAAIVLTTAGLYDTRNKKFLEMSDVLEALGIVAHPREPSEAERIFMQSHAGLREIAKREG
jgi:acyl-CoA thioesterase FadM